ncbi:MAG: hypothetical protein ACKOYK_14275 [Cyanobium sp.]
MALALEGFFVERFGCLSLDVAIFNELLCHLHQPGGRLSQWVYVIQESGNYLD